MTSVDEFTQSQHASHAFGARQATLESLRDTVMERWWPSVEPPEEQAHERTASTEHDNASKEFQEYAFQARQ